MNTKVNNDVKNPAETGITSYKMYLEAMKQMETEASFHEEVLKQRYNKLAEKISLAGLAFGFLRQAVGGASMGGRVAAFAFSKAFSALIDRLIKNKAVAEGIKTRLTSILSNAFFSSKNKLASIFAKIFYRTAKA